MPALPKSNSAAASAADTAVAASTSSPERRGGQPSMADAPFHAPPDVVVDLPFPPSVNKIWRHSSAALAAQQVYLAPSYRKWKDAADALLLSAKGWRSQKISGFFTAEIIICAPTAGHQRGDLDNRVKAIFDFLQRVEIIENDKGCQKFSIEWGNPETAPAGCRVTIRPLASENGVAGS